MKTSSLNHSVTRGSSVVEPDRQLGLPPSRRTREGTVRVTSARLIPTRSGPNPVVLIRQDKIGPWPGVTFEVVTVVGDVGADVEVVTETCGVGINTDSETAGAGATGVMRLFESCEPG